jgi:O-antigen/teichoic acid export membrane protein
MPPVRSLSLNDAVRFLFGRITTEDHRRRRVLNIIQSVVTSLGNKAIYMLVSFLSVPLTIRYLGPERYGAWVTIGSVLAWLSLTDFGLGNGLTNAVTTAAGQDRPDLARMHLSNGIFLLSLIAGATAVVALAAWPFIDWSALFGVTSPEAQSEIGPAVAVALAIFLLQFPLGMGGKVYLAYQEGRIGSYWGAAGNVLSLAALLVVTQTQGGLVWLVIAVSGTSLVVNLASNLWVFVLHRPILAPKLRHVELGAMRSLSKVGGKFFLIQILSLIVFQTDNLVVGHYLGAGHVPDYSLTYTLFSYTSLPQSALFSYLWAAYTEAIARKDIAWVSRTFHLNLVLGMVFTAIAVVGIAAIAKPFIGWWTGGAVVPSTALIVWMAAWSLINAFTNPIACLLASAAHLRTQITYSALAAAVNLPLSIYLVQQWGASGVIAATVISYTFFICVPCYLDGERLLKRLRHAV